MSVLLVLKIIISLATAATGLLAFLKPDAVYGFTGLTAPVHAASQKSGPSLAACSSPWA